MQKQKRVRQAASRSGSKAKKAVSSAKTKSNVTRWLLRLYVAGNTPNSVAAFANLKEICENHLGGRYQIDLVDLLREPQLAAGDQIIAVPTLVRRLPYPVKKIIGDLSNTERVLVGLDLRPASEQAFLRKSAGR